MQPMNKRVSERQVGIEDQSSYQVEDLRHTGQVPWLIVLRKVVTGKGRAGQHQRHELGIGKHAK
jgi:hypothetical protein